MLAWYYLFTALFTPASKNWYSSLAIYIAFFVASYTNFMLCRCILPSVALAGVAFYNDFKYIYRLMVGCSFNSEKSFDMNGIKAIEEHGIQPFKHLGLTHPFFTINSKIILHTWFLLGLLLCMLLITRFFIQKKESVIGFLARNMVEGFMSMVEQNLGYFSYRHCLFIIAIFTFIFTCNLGALIPYLEEPTQDLNTTLALGIISFLYVQINAIKAHGLLSYIKEFFTPFFIMFPINIIGELATIISISFRLYGNIYGGSIIGTIYQGAVSSSVWTEILGLLSGFNFIVLLFFGLFEGLIQAFVFSMLSLTYLSIAVAQEE